jgi:hypothetical protein
MSHQIPVDLYTRELFEILEETFEQVHGIYLDRGTSLFETLEPISAEVASRPVSQDCASLAAQVKHVCFYLEVLEGHMLNKPLGKVDWQEIWRTTREVTPEEWEAIKSKLKVTYQRVLAMMKGFDTWEGENQIGGSLAILVHTAYHLGEIRQALCTVKG